MKLNVFLLGAAVLLLLNIADIVLQTGWSLVYFAFGAFYTALWAVREARRTPTSTSATQITFG